MKNFIAFFDDLKEKETTRTPTNRNELMRKRCKRDARLFTEYFFEHICRRDSGKMHRDLFELYQKNIHKGEIGQRPGRRQAIAAPRGYAKSTLNTLVFPIHATLYNLEGYIIILSATLKQARQRLSNIKTEFETNAGLKEIFEKELKRKGSWTEEGIEINNVYIDVYSAGTELRGISHGPWRPTLVILDDVENSLTVRSPAQREKLFEWYNEVIENIGDTYTAIEIVGTLLHTDSLLARLLERPDFDARLFKAIEQFAARDDLWEQWRALFANLDDPERADTASRFFKLHRNDMTEGSKVLWHAKEDYYDLICQMTTKGRPAFFKEIYYLEDLFLKSNCSYENTLNRDNDEWSNHHPCERIHQQRRVSTLKHKPLKRYENVSIIQKSLPMIVFIKMG